MKDAPPTLERAPKPAHEAMLIGALAFAASLGFLASFPTGTAAGAMAFLGSGALAWGFWRHRCVSLDRQRRCVEVETIRREAGRTQLVFGRQLRIHEAAAVINHRLLTDSDIADSLPCALEKLGEATGARQATFYEAENCTATGHLLITERSSWADPEELELHGLPLLIRFDLEAAGLSAWTEAFRGGRIVTQSSAGAEGAERMFLDMRQICTLVAIPIVTEGGCMGVLVLDENRLEDAQESETFILRSLASNIVGALMRRRMEKENERNRILLGGILNSAIDAVAALRTVRASDGAELDFEFILGNPSAHRMLGAAAG
ncbi:MAG: GAF domain-containing protein, partial [Opitutaceae bacterium]